jgi:monovalent cation/proton antiporter MnhG/PhaG subunit
MVLWLVGVCLLGGALLCLLAAVGLLRLPDVFMRMHAATKSGVVGCGLILIGVGIADGSVATIVKIAATIVFLLLTTPVAGHLLGRAAYVSGAPFWGGTTANHLELVLQRRHFGPGASPHSSPTTPPTNEPTPVH